MSTPDPTHETRGVMVLRGATALAHLYSGAPWRQVAALVAATVACLALATTPDGEP
jgi:hypothetical protein